MLGYIISDKYEINVENYEIKSFDILHKTDLNIFVVKNNKVLYKNDIINNASAYGHVQVLEWFKNSGYKFKYDENAIKWASCNGNIQVLEWFKNSGFEFKYNDNAFIRAYENRHVQVIEWFKNSGYKLKYYKSALMCSCIIRNHNILRFYSNENMNIKKLIKWIITWPNSLFFIKPVKFKTNNKYLKGYQKN